MELYSLTKSGTSWYQRDEIIEGYSSLIWSEKFNSIGEIELEFPLDIGLKQGLRIGDFLGLDKSNHMMWVHTIEIVQNDDGERIMKVKGDDAISILKWRTAWGNLNPLGSNSRYNRSGTPEEIITGIVDKAILGENRTPFDPTNDPLPYSRMALSGQLPQGNLVPTATMTYQIERPMSVYDYIVPVAEAYAIGFRLYRWNDDGYLYYQTYYGTNRTTDQTTVDPVIFSNQFDNIKNISTLESDKDSPTSYYLYSELARTSVLRADYPASENAGWTRKMPPLVLQDGEGLATNAERVEYLKSVGLEDLATRKPILALDAEITQNTGYIYNQHYYLGDLVDVISDWGYKDRCRVVEQIFVQDLEGERMYPTLKSEVVVTQDSWLGVNPAETWGTPDPDNTWSER